MPATGPNFTDWEQLDAENRRGLLVEDDIGWSEPPARRRRSAGSVAVAPRRTRREQQVVYEETVYDEPVYDQPADERMDLERELDDAWGGRLSAPAAAETYEISPYAFAPDAASESARRTVVITGRGAERYQVARRHPSSGLSFHERARFNPDRTAMWAVLLGVALLLGCIVH